MKFKWRVLKFDELVEAGDCHRMTIGDIRHIGKGVVTLENVNTLIYEEVCPRYFGKPSGNKESARFPIVRVELSEPEPEIIRVELSERKLEPDL